MNRLNSIDKKCILIVDDHQLFRAGLRLIIQSHLKANIFEIEKISDATHITENIDVILLDICLPGLNGIDGMSILLNRWPEAKVMLLSAISHHDDINIALESGASCFINKDSPPQVIIKTVKSLLNNRKLSNAYKNNSADSIISRQKTMLSNRLLEILALLAEGTSNKAIANQLCISEHTVRNHIVTLMEHFKVHNRTQVILAAQKAGYLSSYDTSSPYSI